MSNHGKLLLFFIWQSFFLHPISLILLWFPVSLSYGQGLPANQIQRVVISGDWCCYHHWFTIFYIKWVPLIIITIGHGLLLSSDITNPIVMSILPFDYCITIVIQHYSIPISILFCIVQWLTIKEPSNNDSDSSRVLTRLLRLHFLHKCTYQFKSTILHTNLHPYGRWCTNGH